VKELLSELATVNTDPGALACDVSGPGVIPPPGSVTGPATVPAG